MKNEIGYVMDKGRPILAIHMEKTDLPASLKLMMEGYSALHMHEMEESRYERELSTVFANYLSAGKTTKVHLTNDEIARREQLELRGSAVEHENLQKDHPDQGKSQPEDELAADDPLASALSLTGESFVDDDDEEKPELSGEEMDSLLAGVSERFAGSSEASPKEEDLLPVAVLDGSASPQQLEEHEKLLQDEEYRERFETLESTHLLVAEALPAALSEEKAPEPRPLPEATMDTLLAGVRKEFQQEEAPQKERADTKVISFPTYLMQLAAAAAVVFAFIQFYDGGGGDSNGPAAPGGDEVLVASAIEFGDWDDDNILGGGEDDNQTTPFPSWVEFQPYSNKTERKEWLASETPGKAIVKVWVDGDHGVVKIHRPGKKDVEEIPLDDDKDERPQVLAILEKLRKEISGKP